MIISCDQCLKKFEIDSKLIPDEGRLLQCSSCHNKWFYKKDIPKKCTFLLSQWKKNLNLTNYERTKFENVLNQLDFLSFYYRT